jgi:hypothetical protein
MLWRLYRYPKQLLLPIWREYIYIYIYIWEFSPLVQQIVARRSKYTEKEKYQFSNTK